MCNCLSLSCFILPHSTRHHVLLSNFCASYIQLVTISTSIIYCTLSFLVSITAKTQRLVLFSYKTIPRCILIKNKCTADLSKPNFQLSIQGVLWPSFCWPVQLILIISSPHFNLALCFCDAFVSLYLRRSCFFLNGPHSSTSLCVWLVYVTFKTIFLNSPPSSESVSVLYRV